ncbi:putative MFS family arabinose efflux permease [Anaerospora hongkongensis]|uniref:Putative MFS family arabinose efflux permease n=1 Tax=Anaerospora hongkongensis TaxID=244830 RepID=A0A4R1Q152_9FIRM|nr:MFS transporter [Anaerospora hongkongensis]TCL39288.1 putative MFS family arabinose efflux permease [Anaerospora hongkongensis]
MHNQQFLLNTSHIIIDGLFDSVPILLSFIVISLGAGEKETGIIISLAVMGSTLLGLSTLLFSRYLGLLRTLSVIILLYGIGFFTSAFSKNIYLTGFCFIIAVAGYCVFHNIAFAYLTTNSDRRSLGRNMGNFTAIGDIGRIPFASLAAFIAAFSTFGLSGWQIVCLAYGLGAILFAGYIFFSSKKVKMTNYPEALPADGPARHFPCFSLLRKRQYALPIGANILDALGSDQIFTFLPYLIFAKGIDAKIIASFALAFTLGCILGKVACGRMVDLFGTRKVFILSEIFMALLLVVLVLGDQLFIIIGASLLLGIVTKGTIPVIQTIITEPVKDKHNYDDVISISTFSRGTTNMVTPLFFGFIASLFGINWIYSIMAIAVVCAIIPVLIMDTPAARPLVKNI